MKDRVLIGMGAIVMDGAVIEEEVILAAGSVVPPGRVLKSGFVYRGNPATEARPITEKERSFFPYTAKNYAKLKDLHQQELDGGVMSHRVGPKNVPTLLDFFPKLNITKYPNH